MFKKESGMKFSISEILAKAPIDEISGFPDWEKGQLLEIWENRQYQSTLKEKNWKFNDQEFGIETKTVISVFSGKRIVHREFLDDNFEAKSWLVAHGFNLVKDEQ